MRAHVKPILYALAGALAATLLITGNALAGSGVGANFNLGQTNAVNATSILTGTTGGPQLKVLNANASNHAILAQSAGGTGIALYGQHTTAAGTGPALRGDSASTAANAFSILGVLGSNTPGSDSAAVRGLSKGTNSNGYGVWGSQDGTGAGVFGNSPGGIGVRGQSLSGVGVFGTHTAVTGVAPGVRGVTNSPDGFAGYFTNATAGPGTAGVGLAALGRGHTEAALGIGGDGFDGAIEAAGPNGVEGNSTTPGGYGVTGDAPGVGVVGSATAAGGTGGAFTGGSNGTGVSAFGHGAGSGVSAFGGNIGLSASGSQFGVDSNVTGTGAVGVRSTTGSSANDAVQGNTSGGISDAVQGTAAGNAAFAIFGIASGGGIAGVFSSTNSTGVSVGSGTGRAVSAGNGSATNPTVVGSNATAGGTAGDFNGDTALNAHANGQTFATGLNVDLTGDTDGNGTATDDGNNAIFASSDDSNNSATISTVGCAISDAFTCEALESFGFVDINGNARVTGTLTKGAGAFEIDHPLDPAHYFLRHSFVESPDMKNIYDGIVTTDGSGRATVELPAYFGALNKDFRYQLTVIGQFAQAIISKEIADGGRTFEIRTDKPTVKVSWQVTGIRKDAYANAHRIKVVEPKTGAAAGQYLHPELFGQPNAAPLGLDLAKPAPAPSTAAATAEADLRALIAEKRQQALEDARRATTPPAQAPPATQPRRPVRVESN